MGSIITCFRKIFSGSVDLIRQMWPEFLALLGVWLFVLILNLTASPYQRGFFCNDESLSYPYRESTVPTSVVISVGLLPIIVMAVVEVFRWLRTKRARYQTSIPKGNCNIHPVVIEVTHLVAVFLFGAGCSQLATDIGKFSIGRLRPHFIDICKPNLALLCPPDVSPTTYILDFECNGSDQHRISDARLSFPSGHASFSAYTMLYLAIYLQALKTSSRGLKRLRSCLQALAIGFFWYTALSRVFDYKHHWSDVLAGAFIGLATASLTAKYVSHLFEFPCDETNKDTVLEPMNGVVYSSSSNTDATVVETMP